MNSHSILTSERSFSSPFSSTNEGEAHVSMKLRRSKGVISLSKNSENHLKINSQEVSSVISQTKLKNEKLQDAEILMEQHQFTEAKAILLNIKNKTVPVLRLLEQINRIESEKKKIEKPQRCLEEKLANNLRYAEAQRKSELPKHFALSMEAIPSAICFNDWPSQLLFDESKPLDGREVGIVQCQGPREEMQDKFLVDKLTFVSQGVNYSVPIYAVFDGHGGLESVSYVFSNLSQVLKNTLEKNTQSGISDEGIYSALMECFQILDEGCIDFKNGTTATVALIFKNVWIANSGDSKAVLSRDQMGVQLTHDAKINDPRFIKKVERRGGTITELDFVLRVENAVNIACSLGDRYVIGNEGDCCVSAKPQITYYPIEKGLNRLLLATDGLFDVISTDEAISSIQKLTTLGMTSSEIAKTFVYSAYKNGSKDNIVVIIVDL